MEAEAVDQAEQALGDVLRRLVTANLACLLALPDELREQVDEERAASAGAGSPVVAADREAPIIHEEPRLQLALLVERKVVDHQLVESARTGEAVELHVPARRD